MATDNDAELAISISNQKNLSYKDRITRINADLDILNIRLSDDGLEDGTPDDGADAAVIAAKVQTALISDRIDVLFPLVRT